MENKTMMKLVIGTEAIFFLCLIMSFIYLAFVSGYEPANLKALNIKAAAVFTGILIASSGTFQLAEKSYKKGNTRWLKRWLLVTLLLGLIFLSGQAREYIGLVHQQITVSSSLFGASFYTLTGFHSLHVLIGLVIFIILFVLISLGDFEKPGSSVISCAGMYWHFVDIVWLVVFMIVYVLPVMHLVK